jgi:hypothetical protein
MKLRRLRRIVRLPAGDVWLMVAAQWWLARAASEVRRRPSGRLLSEANPAGASTAVAPGGDAVGEEDLALARRLALAVERVSENGPLRATCLVRSVALQRMMERRGLLGSRIHIGVRMVEGEFLAHAWVEWRGEILGDRPWHVGRFSPLADVAVAAGR